MEMISEICYEFRMIGVPVDGPADVFFGTESVVRTLAGKKFNEEEAHQICEACAGGAKRLQRRTPKPTSGAVSGGETLQDLSSRWIQMDCTKRKKKVANNQCQHQIFPSQDIDHGAWKRGNAKC